MIKRIVYLPLLFVLFSFSHSGNKMKIWMIGDSTMSIKQVKAYPETGWGMPFVHFWDSTVVVDNRALNGRSTRTFLEEKKWEPIMNEMSEGDYVFIQFGHNDEVPTKKSYVTENEFRNNLIGYINDTRKKKAIPILLTSIARRVFDSTGKLTDTHAAYSKCTREVAKETNVTLIDMDARSRALLQQMGPEASIYLFNHLQPAEHPNYPNGVKDNTHFNELGARRMAELVLEEIRKQEPTLAERIIKK